MAFFSSFNKSRIFNLDTSKFNFDDPSELYKDLQKLYSENGPDHEYQLKALYIGTKSLYDPETPMGAISTCYVNLPMHQLSEVKEMLANPRAVKAINEGKAGFIIRKYHQMHYDKDCYAAEWIDVDPADYDSEEEDA